MEEKIIIDGEGTIVSDHMQASKKPARVILNPDKPVVSYVLVGIILAIFLFVNLMARVREWPMNYALFYYGSKVNFFIIQGEYWRLFTAMFLHVDVIHVGLNAYVLYIYGPLVEKLYGKTRFIIIYLLAGLLSSAFSFAFNTSASVGASGAIFGIIGALLYLYFANRTMFDHIFGKQLFIFIGINLFIGFTVPMIDNSGHIGGLIGGFLMAYALGLFKDTSQLKVKALFVLSYLLAFALSMVIGFNR